MRAQLNPRETLSRAARWIGAIVAVALALVGALALAPPAGGASRPSCSSRSQCIRPAAAHSQSHGYWLVGRDGGIFSFGSAQFYGSTGALRLQRPVVGIAATPDHGGYWLVAQDGGVFAFGDAGFYGSLPGLGFAPAGTTAPLRLNAPVVGIVPSRDGGGYFMVASDGGVFAFGDAPFEGSCPGIGGCAGAGHVVMPANGNGYWLVTRTGHVYAFGDAPYLGGAGGKGFVTSAAGTRNGREIPGTPQVRSCLPLRQCQELRFIAQT